MSDSNCDLSFTATIWRSTSIYIWFTEFLTGRLFFSFHLSYRWREPTGECHEVLIWMLHEYSSAIKCTEKLIFDFTSGGFWRVSHSHRIRIYFVTRTHVVIGIYQMNRDRQKILSKQCKPFFYWVGQRQTNNTYIVHDILGFLSLLCDVSQSATGIYLSWSLSDRTSGLMYVKIGFD